MAQQSPLSKSLSVQNSAACPLTLANGFSPCSSVTSDLYAVDPNFRVGYAQNWQASLQRDLPGSLQMTATYLGIKGTRGVQEFLPNTYPIGAAEPLPELSRGICLSRLQRQLHSPGGAGSVAAEAAQRTHRDPPIHLFRSPSMMIPPWEDRVRPRSHKSPAREIRLPVEDWQSPQPRTPPDRALRRSRRTGWISRPNAGFRLSINATF